MTGDVLIGEIIIGLLLTAATLLTSLLIFESRKRRRICLAITATIVGCICLDILWLQTH